jgi:NADH-quinone oxidoreductase subunit G
MTLAPEKSTEIDVPEGHVALTIDGIQVTAPKGELVIRTCERLGIHVPRFCDHPLLDPAGACRQCLVEAEMGGRPMPKPQASCTLTVADGMVVKTQHTSPVADKAQQGVMELLLINHPLDCPICDKGGECPLQNQAMSNGRADSRFYEPKRTFPKPIPITVQVLLDRERCVLCARCTRFAGQIAGDQFIDMLERGPDQQVGTARTAGLPGAAELGPVVGGQSYFSGNTIQICPVGALTSAAYRFRARPFDLVSTPSVCEHCASGCAQRTDWRRGTVMRRLAGNDPAVNEEWNCDKGRFAFTYATAPDRLTRPLVRDVDSGELRETSWTDALRAAADGLARAKARGVGVLAGGRLTVEDAYAYGKFARVALGTNDVDFRARPHSAEELEFLAAAVVGSTPESGGVTYAELESAPVVLCVAFEPEEESPIVFLRLRKAARGPTQVWHLSSWTSPGVAKTGGRLLRCVPGQEVTALADLPASVVELLRAPGAVVLAGERAAEVPGLLAALTRLAADTGARLAWVPRRAGERGALVAGAAPNLLPGGRAVTDAAARAEIEQAWGLAPGTIPDTPGRSTDEMLHAAASGGLGALVVGGVDPGDLADPALAERALREVGFVVSLELRRSAVTAHADVVLPVAPAVHKSGSYLTWEGRHRPFATTIESTSQLPDCRVLDSLAVEMDADLYTQTPAAAAAQLQRLGGVPSSTTNPPLGGPSSTTIAAVPHTDDGVSSPGIGRVVLATWRALLDNGSLQDNEPHLAGTARPATARLNVSTAAALGVTFGERVSVATTHGAITLPAAEADLPDGVVWLPSNSGPATVRRTLGAGHGALVTVTPGPAAGAASASSVNAAKGGTR